MGKIVLYGQKDGNYQYISFDEEIDEEGRFPNICFSRINYPEGEFEKDEYDSTLYTKYEEDYDIYEKDSETYNLLINKALILIDKTIINFIKDLKNS